MDVVRLGHPWNILHSPANLPQELDFRNEAKNAARCAANFRSRGSKLRDRVAVPGVLPALSSERVLTMEFMTGCGVTDIPALKAAGLNPPEVSSVYQ